MQLAPLVLCGLFSLGAGVETINVDLELKPSDARYHLPAPAPQQIMLSEQPGQGVKSPPHKKGILWGEIPFGPTTQPGGVAILIDESNAAMAIRLDANRNGDLTDDPPIDWKLIDGDRPEMARYEGELFVPTGDGAAGDRLKLLAYRYSSSAAKARGVPELALFYFRDYGAAGTTKVSTGTRQTMLTDESSIGDFTFPNGRSSNLLLGLDADGDGVIRPVTEWFRTDQPVVVLDKQFQLKRSSADGRHIELSVVPAGTKIAQAFSGPALGGGTIRFPEDFKGKLVLLTFWASWCPHCKTEMPNIVALKKQYEGDKDVAFLGVSLDRADGEKAAKEYLAKIGASWPQIYDGTDFKTPPARKYAVSGVPSSYLIDTSNMTIVADGMPMRGPQMATTLSSWLKKRKPTN